MVSRESYFQKLGEFVHAFAQAESALNLVFHHFAKVPAEVANILKRDGVSRVAGLTREVVKVNDFDAETRSEVKRLLDQLGTIGDLRNKILHHGAIPHESKPGMFVWNNAATAKGMESYQELEFGASALDTAAQDLRAIGLRLLALALPDEYPINPRLRDRILGPWLYRPVEATAPYRQRDSTPRTS